MGAIDLIQTLGNSAAGVREKLYNEQFAAKSEAFDNGVDPEHIRNWKWPFPKE
jgi:xylulose-5-phosphate/fructose-6-phosphate phosphoketolase